MIWPIVTTERTNIRSMPVVGVSLLLVILFTQGLAFAEGKVEGMLRIDLQGLGVDPRIVLCGRSISDIAISAEDEPFTVMVDWPGRRNVELPRFVPGDLRAIRVVHAALGRQWISRVELEWGSERSYQVEVVGKCLSFRFRLPVGVRGWRPVSPQIASSHQTPQAPGKTRPILAEELLTALGTNLWELDAEVPPALPSVTPLPTQKLERVVVARSVDSPLSGGKSVSARAQGKRSLPGEMNIPLEVQSADIPSPTEPAVLGVSLPLPPGSKELTLREAPQNEWRAAVPQYLPVPIIASIEQEAAQLPREPMEQEVIEQQARATGLSRTLRQPLKNIPVRSYLPTVAQVVLNPPIEGHRTELRGLSASVVPFPRGVVKAEAGKLDRSSRKSVLSPFGGEDTKAREQFHSPRASKKLPKKNGPARVLSDIGFQQLANTSRVFVRLNRKARYRYRPSPAPDTFVLEIQQTQVIKQSHLLPMDTAFFPGPVAFFQARRIGENVHLEVRLRKATRWEIKAQGTTIVVDFTSTD
ncbi:MAG: hypothetical protein KTR25_17255 [Myxococcales bacterium]|nr:hypothetical protein [Myxococcales bacterium]